VARIGVSSFRIARAGIGRKFQVPAVFDALTVAENLAVPRWSGQRLAMLRRADLAADEEELARIHLAGKGAVQAGTLSHGERQWLEIGMLCWRHACACCCWTSPPPA
jgi:urea transport system ATP-binding protein